MARGVVTGGFDAGYFFECEVETDPPSDGEGRDAKDATRRTSASKKRLRGVLFSPVLTSQRVTAAGEPTLTLPSYCFPGAMAYAGAIQRVEFRGDENENATSDVFAWEKAAAAAKKRRLLPSDDASDGREKKKKHSRSGREEAAREVAERSERSHPREPRERARTNGLPGVPLVGDPNEEIGIPPIPPPDPAAAAEEAGRPREKARVRARRGRRKQIRF